MTPSPRVSILIPQHKTLDLTRLCLRLLRRHTDPALARVIVIDNYSDDESLDYLRSLRWIQLIERQRPEPETPSAMHARALDLALADVTTPYVLSIHTDTLVGSDHWLTYLLGQLESAPDVGGVGSWKLEPPAPWKDRAKQWEDRWIRPLRHWLRGTSAPPPELRYLRSHCALYRVSAIRECHTCFFDEGETAGLVLHRKLTAAGWRMIFLPAADLLAHLQHLNHATLILHPEYGGRRTSKPRARRKLQRQLDALHYREVLNNPALDV